MQINVINADKPEIELIADSTEDEQQIAKLITSKWLNRSPISFPRKDKVRSVRIQVEKRKRSF